MSGQLYRLVYVSRNQIKGSESELLAEIASILEVSRRCNGPEGVTGALMYNAGCFAQVLEGDHDTLQETFERIQCDLRHSEVRLLGLDAVDERGFGNWSMAYVGQDEASREAFEAMSHSDALDPENMPSERIFALLKEHLIDGERELQTRQHAA